VSGAVSCRAAAALACALLLVACGRSGAAGAGAAPDPRATAVPAVIPNGDWTEFGYDPARGNVGPGNTGIIAGDLGSLRRRIVHLDGTVDSSPIELHGVRVRGRTRDVIVVTTT
jgi:hypothetical protein